MRREEVDEKLGISPSGVLCPEAELGSERDWRSSMLNLGISAQPLLHSDI